MLNNNSILTENRANPDLVENENWIFACYADDVPENGGVCVKHDDLQIAVFNFSRRGKWFATDNLCPHKKQMALSRGMIGSTGEQCEPKVACPFHKKTFSLITGECLNGDDYQVKIYTVREVNGKIFLNLD